MLSKRHYHFHLHLNNIDFVYTYIRKNACSAFKKFFVANSNMRDNIKYCNSYLEFMMKYHRVKSIDSLKAFEHKIAVIRNPSDRVISAYLNQFIQRLKKGSDLSDSISRNISVSLDLLTFREFVSEYLAKVDFERVDCHFWPQKEHLAPINYNHLWLLDNLAENSEKLFGYELANKFFKHKTNSTSKYKKYDDNAVDLSAIHIYERFLNQGDIPSYSAMLDDELEAIINQLYYDDFELFYTLKSHCITLFN
ncbi:sulfotransferase family 2 domain-containing protein [Lyngbya aestuarii]|nr:sulfotransferase family 2 domain-containing protein [Lyngbya aestuarii]